MNTLTDSAYRYKLRDAGFPCPLSQAEINRRARAAIDAIAYSMGVKPKRLRTEAEQRAWATILQRRNRAERRGQDVSQYPPRVRLALAGGTESNAASAGGSGQRGWERTR